MRDSVSHLELLVLLALPPGVDLEVLLLVLEPRRVDLRLLQLPLQVVQLVQQLLLVRLDLKGEGRNEESQSVRGSSALIPPTQRSLSFDRQPAGRSGMTKIPPRSIDPFSHHIHRTGRSEYSAVQINVVKGCLN